MIKAGIIGKDYDQVHITYYIYVSYKKHNLLVIR